MPVLNRIAAFADDMTAWRRHLHAHPELGFDCHETAGFVAARLRDFGVDEIHEGIARTGIVAIIEGRASGPMVFEVSVHHQVVPSQGSACGSIAR